MSTRFSIRSATARTSTLDAFEEGKHKRDGGGRFTAYSAGTARHASTKPGNAFEKTEHDHQAHGHAFSYDLHKVKSGSKIHGVVTNVRPHVGEDDPAPSPVTMRKLQLAAIADAKPWLEQSAEEETEGSRYDSLTRSERKAEDDARKAEEARKDREHTARIHAAVDKAVAGGFRPEVGGRGGWKRPDGLREFASPKSLGKIDARLLHHGIDVKALHAAAKKAATARAATHDRATSMDRAPWDESKVKRAPDGRFGHVAKTPVYKDDRSGQVHVVTKTTVSKAGRTRTAIHGTYASLEEADAAARKIEAKHGVGAAQTTSHKLANHRSHLSIRSSRVVDADGKVRREIHAVSAHHGRIHGKGPKGAGHKTSRHVVHGRMSPLFAEPKARKGGAKPQHLVGFLAAAGGIQDQGGNLKAAGLHTLHRGLVKKTGGIPLDRAREMAAEAGYLGADKPRAVAETDINDLLGAIGHHPSYSVHDLDRVHEREERKARRQGRSHPSSSSHHHGFPDLPEALRGLDLNALSFDAAPETELDHAGRNRNDDRRGHRRHSGLASRLAAGYAPASHGQAARLGLRFPGDGSGIARTGRDPGSLHLRDEVMAATFAIRPARAGASKTLDAWEESLHPRKGGKFVSKGGGASSTAPKPSRKSARTPGTPRAPKGHRSVADKTLAVRSSGKKAFDGNLHVVTKTTTTKAGSTRTAVHGVYASEKAAKSAHAKLTASGGKAALSSHQVHIHDGTVPTHVSVQSRIAKAADGSKSRVVHGVSIDHAAAHEAGQGKLAKTTRHAVDGSPKPQRPQVGDRIHSDEHGPGTVTKSNAVFVESDHGGKIVRRSTRKVAPKPVAVPKAPTAAPKPAAPIMPKVATLEVRPAAKMPKATPLIVAADHSAAIAAMTKAAGHAKHHDAMAKKYNASGAWGTAHLALAHGEARAAANADFKAALGKLPADHPHRVAHMQDRAEKTPFGNASVGAHDSFKAKAASTRKSLSGAGKTVADKAAEAADLRKRAGDLAGFSATIRQRAVKSDGSTQGDKLAAGSWATAARAKIEADRIAKKAAKLEGGKVGDKLKKTIVRAVRMMGAKG